MFSILVSVTIICAHIRLSNLKRFQCMYFWGNLMHWIFQGMQPDRCEYWDRHFCNLAKLPNLTLYWRNINYCYSSKYCIRSVSQFNFHFPPRFLSSLKWQTLRCWHSGWLLHWPLTPLPPQLLLRPAVNITLFHLNECFPFLPCLVSTASLLSLLWPAVRLCASSTSGEMQSHRSPNSLICVRSHVSEFCGWLRTPVVERTPTSIALPCCAACLGCRSSTTKVVLSYFLFYLSSSLCGRTPTWLAPPLFAVVTEEEVAQALTEGEEVTALPNSFPKQTSTNGIQDAEIENDPLNYNMEETK